MDLLTTFLFLVLICYWPMHFVGNTSIDLPTSIASLVTSTNGLTDDSRSRRYPPSIDVIDKVSVGSIIKKIKKAFCDRSVGNTFFILF